MSHTLKLYRKGTDASNQNPEPFPGSGDSWAVISDYKYSAGRMGGAPTISATLKWHSCLDNEWSDDVFVEFRGERYFIKNIPSSSYDNASIMYTHTLTLEAERAVLDNIYFFNTVKTSDENDEYLSESATFSFFGSILEFSDRLNKSLRLSGVGGPDGYNVVVDRNVVSEEFLYESSQLYITDALKHAYEVYHIPYYYVGKIIHFGYFQTEIDEVLKYGADKSLISIKKNNTAKQVVNKITGLGSSNNITYFYPNPTPKGFIEIWTNSKYASFFVGNDMTFSSKMDLNRPARYRSTEGFIVSRMKYSHNGTDFIDGNIDESFDAKVNNELWLQYKFSSDSDLPQYTYIDCVFNYEQDQIPITSFYVDSKLELNGNEFPAFLFDGGIFCGNLNPGTYTLTLHLKFPSIGSATSYRGSFSPSYRKHSYWEYEDNMDIFSLEDATITFRGTLQPLDKIEQISTMRIPVQSTLMPSRYRNSNGKDRWYVATNAANRDEEDVIYGDVVFKNEYSDVRPREYIHTDDKIMPTIKEVINASGQRIDMFSAFAYDLLDNDEIYPEDYSVPELAGKYKHPYFFAKLRKLDGPNGFNLFDQAIAGGKMTISFTSGMVGGCSFTIGVDETSQKNLVQVYEQNVYDSNGTLIHAKGSLKRDPNTGDILSGYGPNGGSQQAQDIQNDTINNEVWIALKKEDSTFGVLMPNAENKFKPSTDDTFVILNIDLPDGYIISAEKKLEQELIKYMADNNSNKFSFSVVLSSIFFEDTPSISNVLNENSKVKVSYNDELYTLYVSSYSYSISEGKVLPEVTLELNDDIKVFKGIKQQLKDDTKKQLIKIDGKVESIGSIATGTNNLFTKVSDGLSLLDSSVKKITIDVDRVSGESAAAKLLAMTVNENLATSNNEIAIVQNKVDTLIGDDPETANKSVFEIASIAAGILLPSETAPATPRNDMRGNITNIRLILPNIMHDWSGESREALRIPTLSGDDTAYDNKWMVRFSMITSDGLTIPFDVMWKDGIAPSWSEWSTCEITFSKDGIGNIMGEWKLYR